ncbi:hypothetical protein E2493_06175 [Sphingomonas parva]|uniref:Uncharacterized protein n=1 Tax=Sphingomonas parva TaxID=2555898 RepID=A0A4Y8ZWM5_9SPHN|nr:hypothetical protein [Sphingomonas parva]TFI59109.1 hypothetical protein E2493_06175 [Sphingomonas parva]
MAGKSAPKEKSRGKGRRTGAPMPDAMVPVRNVRPGTILHLGDGRRIGFGEIAAVARPLAATLRRSGQARPVPR